MMNLDQQRRYARQIMLPELGEAGQQRLREARVLVVGAGGLGASVLTYLAAAGVGTLGIIDPDRVELSNLARQIIHETGDIGRLKVESASDRIAELNPDVRVIPYPFALTTENACAVIGGAPLNILQSSPLEGEPNRPCDLVGGYHLIVDGCDNFATRLAVNAACVALGIPLVSAAIAGWEGQLASFAPHLAPEAGCYQCFVNPDAPEVNTCRESGVIGPLAGVMGAMQAQETLLMLLDRPALLGTLLRFDGRSMQQRTSRLTRDAGCGVCGNP